MSAKATASIQYLLRLAMIDRFLSVLWLPDVAGEFRTTPLQPPTLEAHPREENATQEESSPSVVIVPHVAGMLVQVDRPPAFEAENHVGMRKEVDPHHRFEVDRPGGELVLLLHNAVRMLDDGGVRVLPHGRTQASPEVELAPAPRGRPERADAPEPQILGGIRVRGPQIGIDVHRLVSVVHRGLQLELRDLVTLVQGFHVERELKAPPDARFFVVHVGRHQESCRDLRALLEGREPLEAVVDLVHICVVLIPRDVRFVDGSRERCVVGVRVLAVAELDRFSTGLGCTGRVFEHDSRTCSILVTDARDLGRTYDGDRTNVGLRLVELSTGPILDAEGHLVSGTDNILDPASRWKPTRFLRRTVSRDQHDREHQRSNHGTVLDAFHDLPFPAV